MIDLTEAQNRLNTFRKKLSMFQDELDELTNTIEDIKSKEQKLESKFFEPYAVVYVNTGFVAKIIGESDNDLLSVFGDGSRAWLDKRSSIKIIDPTKARNILTEIHGDPTMERVKKLWTDAKFREHLYGWASILNVLEADFPELTK